MASSKVASAKALATSGTGLLLDTHAFLWWLAGDPQLPAAARRKILATARIHVSAASVWEITTKARLGKLPGALAVAADVAACIAAQSFLPLDITTAHAQRAGSLPGPHRDPFDRMLVAQALTDGLEMVSNEAIFDLYGVRRVW